MLRQKSYALFLGAALVIVFAAVRFMPAKAASKPSHTHVVTQASGLWPGRKVSIPATIKGQRIRRVQWFRCNRKGRKCGKIAGATHRFYTVRRADVGHTLMAQAATLSAKVDTAPTPVVGHGRPKNTVLPTISDDGAGGGSATAPVVGDNLGGNAGSWNEAIGYSYQWFDCVPSGQTPPAGFVQTATLDGLACAPGTGNASPSAEGSSTAAPAYALTDADVGFDIVLEVTAFNS